MNYIGVLRMLIGACFSYLHAAVVVHRVVRRRTMT